jgi:hypothetical protein
MCLYNNAADLVSAKTMRIEGEVESSSLSILFLSTAVFYKESYRRG